MRCLVIYPFARGHHFEELAFTLSSRIFDGRQLFPYARYSLTKISCSDLYEEKNVCLLQSLFIDNFATCRVVKVLLVGTRIGLGT